MKTIKGDLVDLALKGEFDIIVHGANCQHTMGSGVAKAIREAFPEAYEADLATPNGRSKLGTISVAEVTRNGHAFLVVNAYTQDHFGTDRRHVDYIAVMSAMSAVKDLAEEMHPVRIGYPKIGAGLGGGDWAVISAIIDEELEGEDHILVELA